MVVSNRKGINLQSSDNAVHLLQYRYCIDTIAEYVSHDGFSDLPQEYSHRADRDGQYTLKCDIQ